MSRSKRKRLIRHDQYSAMLANGAALVNASTLLKMIYPPPFEGIPYITWVKMQKQRVREWR